MSSTALLPAAFHFLHQKALPNMGQGKGGGGEERGSVSSDCSYVIAIKGLAREQSQSLDLIEHGQGRE